MKHHLWRKRESVLGMGPAPHPLRVQGIIMRIYLCRTRGSLGVFFRTFVCAPMSVPASVIYGKTLSVESNCFYDYLHSFFLNGFALEKLIIAQSHEGVISISCLVPTTVSDIYLHVWSRRRKFHGVLTSDRSHIDILIFNRWPDAKRRRVGDTQLEISNPPLLP